ncbi:MAG: sugar nucleotide-binding protein, partial [Acetobacteraceae bacterium]|nr:sugar nucleotide-binding protein [Acetobacteraceae bacterium]
MGPVLITGGEGQLARALADATAAAGIAAVRVGRPEFDFDRPDGLDAPVRAHAP